MGGNCIVGETLCLITRASKLAWDRIYFSLSTKYVACSESPLGSYSLLEDSSEPLDSMWIKELAEGGTEVLVLGDLKASWQSPKRALDNWPRGHHGQWMKGLLGLAVEFLFRGPAADNRPIRERLLLDPDFFGLFCFTIFSSPLVQNQKVLLI